MLIINLEQYYKFHLNNKFSNTKIFLLRRKQGRTTQILVQLRFYFYFIAYFYDSLIFLLG